MSALQLAHPILESLKGSSSEWLMELLLTFNQGSISKFEAMKPQWSTQPDLLTKENQLREKIRLLCLMEVKFQALLLRVYCSSFPISEVVCNLFQSLQILTLAWCLCMLGRVCLDTELRNRIEVLPLSWMN